MIAPEEALEAISQRFGRHPGWRALHAKGSCYRATFSATVDASRLTRAAHMQHRAIQRSRAAVPPTGLRSVGAAADRTPLILGYFAARP